MSTSQEKQFCTFYLDEGFFGVAVEMVQEIIRRQEITTVALAPKSITGLINLRGQIVTAIDMRSLLGMPARDSDEKHMNIVVQTTGGGFSLIVDKIGDALCLDKSLSEPPPANVRGSAKDLIKSAYKLDGKLLLTLDVNELVSAEVLANRDP